MNDDYNKNNKIIWPNFIIEAKKHNEKLKKNKKNIKKQKNKNIKDTGKPFISKKNSKLRGRGAIKKITNENELLNIKNMKTNFKRSCKNYFIKDNKLYYKKKVKFKNIQNKWENKIIDMYVPTINQLNELLYKYHVNTCHSNYKELRELFTKNNIGYIGIDNLLEGYVSNCPVCCQTARTLHRTDPIKSININGPDYQYVFDITYLNQICLNVSELKICYLL